MNSAANALYWTSFESQNYTDLTLLKHQNTKTSLYKLSKNHWVITLLESFGSVRRELQSTVSLDHPVVVAVYPLQFFDRISKKNSFENSLKSKMHFFCHINKLLAISMLNKKSSHSNLNLK